MAPLNKVTQLGYLRTCPGIRWHLYLMFYLVAFHTRTYHPKPRTLIHAICHIAEQVTLYSHDAIMIVEMYGVMVLNGTRRRKKDAASFGGIQLTSRNNYGRRKKGSSAAVVAVTGWVEHVRSM